MRQKALMKFSVRFVPVLVAFLVPFLTSAQQALPPVIGGQVDRLASEAMARLHQPSLAISIVNDGQLVFAKAYGESDVENSVPASADTVYRIASLSKSLTSGDAASRTAQAGPRCSSAGVLPGIPIKAVAHYGARGAYASEWYSALQQRRRDHQHPPLHVNPKLTRRILDAMAMEAGDDRRGLLFLEGCGLRFESVTSSACPIPRYGA